MADSGYTQTKTVWDTYITGLTAQDVTNRPDFRNNYVTNVLPDSNTYMTDTVAVINDVVYLVLEAWFDTPQAVNAFVQDTNIIIHSIVQEFKIVVRYASLDYPEPGITTSEFLLDFVDDDPNKLANAIDLQNMFDNNINTPVHKFNYVHRIETNRLFIGSSVLVDGLIYGYEAKLST